MRAWEMNALLDGYGYTRRKEVRFAGHAGQAGNNRRDEMSTILTADPSVTLR